jgi:8-oxo-dGTP pyrophosphatase MutT (NUDIX family)
MTLATHRAFDEEEHLALEHAKALLAGQDDPFARTTLPRHFTASALVVDLTSGRLLLHEHRRLRLWLQPGGHVEDGERPEDAALRETREETGVAAVHPPSGPILVHLDEHLGPDAHVHLDLRFLLHARADAPHAPGEAVENGAAVLRWVVDDELEALTDLSLRRAVAGLRAREAESAAERR